MFVSFGFIQAICSRSPEALPTFQSEQHRPAASTMVVRRFDNRSMDTLKYAIFKPPLSISYLISKIPLNQAKASTEAHF